jgi:alanyl-tRNA synthetase
MTHHEIRKKFIDYFVKAGHKQMPAVSLVPDNDPSVLFTVAGMQQFKDFYQHPDQAPASRVVTIQPCIRTIDIDEIGDDTHNTVFEMLGNFSFGYAGKSAKGESSGEGAYFKETAIHLAWEFLTQELGIVKDRIRATYFGGDAQRPADEASREILEKLEGLSLVEAYGEDNFWGPVGDEGPCGPTIEFYIDDVEVWNVVCNEYFKDREGNYTPLDYQGIDTGMGLERLTAALQNISLIYATDLLASFIALVGEQSYNYQQAQGRIVVDHTKAALYLLADGVKPGKKGRDYILRR